MSYIVSVDLAPFNTTDDDTQLSHLTLCIGPMFAGKTTFLLEKINKLNIQKQAFIVIKPIIDVRYNINKIVNHNGLSYDCISLNKINDLDITNKSLPNIILIDEGQLFPDLYDSVEKMLSLGKQVYVAGLNGDYKMKLFGQIINLISIADDIIYIQALCKCGKPASFTARTVQDESLILIGGSERYIPVCKQCYYKLNDKKIAISKLQTQII